MGHLFCGFVEVRLPIRLELFEVHLAVPSRIKLGHGCVELRFGQFSPRQLYEHAHEAGMSAPFDLLVLDVILAEDRDGLSVLEEIRQHYPEQKAVVASGHAPANIESYVVWGGATGLRMNEAVSQGLWIGNDDVAIGAGHRGIVAVGDTTTAAGYKSVNSPKDCCGL